MALTYNPAVFNVDSISSAMKIILTAEDSATEARWKNETPYLADLIGQKFAITADSLLLDYGCGIGRMAKELIAQRHCRVIGVDISASMRALAPIYVESDRFFACPPAMLDDLIARGVKFDGALAIWVLQHCIAPAEDAARLRRALRPDGRLFVLNGNYRAVPTRERSWANDGIDVRAALDREFALVSEGRPAIEHTSPSIANSCFWAVFRCP